MLDDDLDLSNHEEGIGHKEHNDEGVKLHEGLSHDLPNNRES